MSKNESSFCFSLKFEKYFSFALIFSVLIDKNHLFLFVGLAHLKLVLQSGHALITNFLKINTLGRCNSEAKKSMKKSKQSLG